MQGSKLISKANGFSQGAQCVSGEDVRFACNNVGIQSQEQRGHLAAGQQ